MHDVGLAGDLRAHGKILMEKKYIQIFDGYKGAYGVADWTNVKIDPVSGKKKPDYRWNFEPLTDQILY